MMTLTYVELPLPKYGIYGSKTLVQRAISILTASRKQHQIPRGTCCICGKAGEAHHDDYERPLWIAWLCHKHHKQRHKELGWGSHRKAFDKTALAGPPIDCGPTPKEQLEGKRKPKRTRVENDHYAKDFPAMVYQARVNAGITQECAASICGVSIRTFHRWETGYLKIFKVTAEGALARLAKATDIDAKRVAV